MRQSVEAGAAQLLGMDPGWWSKVRCCSLYGSAWYWWSLRLFMPLLSDQSCLLLR